MPSDSIRQFVGWTVVVVVALPGLFAAVPTLYFLRMVLSALWTGILKRQDYTGDMSDVIISRATDPDWYWGNVEFYGVVSAVLGTIVAAFLFPLAIRIAISFRRGK
jgi:hypothetical protein